MNVVGLLIIANVFMTIAWYGHLRHQDAALWKVIVVSWLIAAVEYMFQVPANRMGARSGWTGFELKITQEVITVAVFTVFAVLYLKERPTWNHAAAFACLVGAVYFTFGFRRG